MRSNGKSPLLDGFDGFPANPPPLFLLCCGGGRSRGIRSGIELGSYVGRSRGKVGLLVAKRKPADDDEPAAAEPMAKSNK